MSELINIAQLAKEYRTKTGNRRDPRSWLELKETQKLIHDLSNRTDSLKSEIVFSRKGNNCHEQGTFVHPELAKKFKQWLWREIEQSNPEKRITEKLAKDLSGYTEILCSTGYIDLVTDSEIIEVKHTKHWKCAVGQVLVYGLDFPDREQRIHLFGKSSKEFKDMVISSCQELNIKVTFEN